MPTSFAWAYGRYGSIPEVRGVLYGVKPVIIAIVLQALWSLARTAIKTKFLAVLGIVAVVVSFLGAHELLVLFGAGVLVGIARITWRQIERGAKPSFADIASAACRVFQSSATTAAMASFGLWPLFLFFLKVGAVLYGSGYVLLASIRADLVDWHEL